MKQTLLKTALRGFFKPFMGPPWPIGFQRRWATALTATNLPARGIERHQVEIGGVHCEMLRRGAADPERCVLFLHGGAYVIGSPTTCRSMTSFIALLSGATVIVPKYRLAPEHPFPAGLDDALAVFAVLRKQYRVVMVSGDSAGGGLSLCLAQTLRDRGEAMPDALALISPWVDLSNDTPSRRERESRDPMLRLGWTGQCVNAYIGDGDPHAPAWSPLFADMKGLPRTLIHVGSEEMLYDDSVRLHAALNAAGVPSTLREFEGLWHDFHMHAAVLPIAREAIQEISDFVDG
jgi:monoterpene epsilon-lactone hydrolase